VNVARLERAALCDLFEELGPDQPTLCEGWTTRDLAAHLVTRERRPDAAVGILVKPVSGFTEQVRSAAAKRPFEELIGQLRRPPFWTMAGFGPTDRAVNTLEFFIHHEDVRRGRPGWEPRRLDPGQQAALGRGVSCTAKLGLRRLHIPVLVRAPGFGEVTVGEGTPQATLTGEPGELALFVSGRQRAARVDVDGPPETAERLRTAALGM
jgi:uncharacterized protein (TIGR03085 family)